jgi:hypothetical protein
MADVLSILLLLVAYGCLIVIRIITTIRMPLVSTRLGHD